MYRNKRWLLSLIVALTMGCLTLSVSAQGTSSGTVVLGQPLQGQLTAGGTLDYDYTVAQLSKVTLQVLGTTSQPTITILRDGESEAVASQPNAENAPTATLSTTLDAGAYTVQVGALNNTSGLVILVLQSETSVTSTALPPANVVNGVVNSSTPLVLYSFDALDTLDAYLYIEATAPEGGITARILNQTTGQLGAEIESDLLGTRLHIPAGSAAYQVEIRQSTSDVTAPFTICIAPASTGSCEAASAQLVAQPTALPPTPIPPTVAVLPTATATLFIPPTIAPIACTVSSSVNGSVNIRQSASTNAIILGTLPNNTPANVIGISPDRFFYNVLYNGINGWIALSVVTSSGDCSTIPTINPPQIVPQPTPIPVQPTQPPPPPTESGPCVIKITAPTYIYTITEATMENLFDQVQPGVQLHPDGIFPDRLWWRLPLYGQEVWIPTSTFGNGAQVTGDCSSLPLLVT
jgi:hypothetical protein